MGYRIPITLGNIEPLASKPFRPGKMALVCEGGGQQRRQAVGDLFGQRLRQLFHLLGSRHLVTQAKIRGALHQQHQQSQANQDNSGAVQAKFQFSASHAGSLGIGDTLCCQNRWR